MRADEARLAEALRRAAADVSEVPGLLGRVDERARGLRRRRHGRALAAGTLAAAAAAVAVVALPGGGPAGTGSVRPLPPAGGSSAAPLPPPPTLGPPASTAASPPASGTDADTDADDFTRLDRKRWTYVYDGGANSPYGSWSAADVTVAGGSLRLAVSRSGDAATSGGVGAASAAHATGRWEVRWRMPRAAAPGVIGQFGLVAAGDEGAGTQPLHLATLDPAAGTLTFAAGERSRSVRVDPARFHTVAVAIGGGAVRWSVDGRQAARWPLAGTRPVWPALQTLLAGPDCGADPLPGECGGRSAAFPQRLEVDRYAYGDDFR